MRSDAAQVEIDGTGVVQLYISDIGYQSSGKPEQELKGYEKVSLKPKKSKKVMFTIEKPELTYYDSKNKGFRFSNGFYEIGIGSSSRDIKLKQTCELL
jgi:beta-glucosidase